MNVIKLSLLKFDPSISGYSLSKASSINCKRAWNDPNMEAFNFEFNLLQVSFSSWILLVFPLSELMVLICTTLSEDSKVNWV
ncbi:hypothetical protein WICPIJ_010001 [Wickerhamomyces pijperi]|uniref:Uncharacterized protein n=1 Tax=Wickerhamomyces pijperi TaxID=599730 RepID=A0A9P8TBY5_WICPI|nr:hypothetical protein WICPIJ_010001 [Wickerhamomyces pijperi]